MDREKMQSVNPWTEGYHNLDLDELIKIIKKYWKLSEFKKKDRNREFIIKLIDDYMERASTKGDAFRHD